ncbi:5681_t:CDS:2 [Dentiscutata erythropus]|uniref:5681_t:CDS:1 n=1 Tax=Dentiscutata erythropus TaxID=1348616 RepID=A0A9N8VBK8_9GLOM|nr:5681_t:CDS:2 [Dentiscutata erythropus]
MTLLYLLSYLSHIPGEGLCCVGTYVLIVELLKSEDQVEVVKKQAENQAKEYARITESEKALQKKLETLTNELDEEKKKARDFDNLKKQASQQNEEYMKLTDNYQELLLKHENRNEDKKND